MIRKIIGTLSARIANAFLILLVVLINARFLGAEKVGTISLIILAITIIQLVNSFVGGAALVYLVPRREMVKLFVPSYLWAFLTSLAVAWILGMLNMIPAGFFLHVLILSLILSFGSINLMILMGQEKIKEYNIITLMQILSLFLILLAFLFILSVREISSYIWSLYGSYSLAFILSLFRIRKGLNNFSFTGSKKILKEIFRYGTVMQLGNIFQFFNYRLSYYFIELFLGRASLGVYATGVQLSESIWLIARSIHLVQYSRISNEKDDRYASRLTLNLLKVSIVFTVLCFLMLYGLIVLFFNFIFKPEFIAIKIIMLILSAGILTFSVSIILSPYFSGSGKPHYNTITAAIGLAFTLLTGLLLIPHMGLPGAALSASISYTVATVFQLFMFIRISGIKVSDFILRRSDIKDVYNQMKASFPLK